LHQYPQATSRILPVLLSFPKIHLDDISTMRLRTSRHQDTQTLHHQRWTNSDHPLLNPPSFPACQPYEVGIYAFRDWHKVRRTYDVELLLRTNNSHPLRLIFLPLPTVVLGVILPSLGPAIMLQSRTPSKISVKSSASFPMISGKTQCFLRPGANRSLSYFDSRLCGMERR